MAPRCSTTGRLQAGTPRRGRVPGRCGTCRRASALPCRTSSRPACSPSPTRSVEDARRLGREVAWRLTRGSRDGARRPERTCHVLLDEMRRVLAIDAEPLTQDTVIDCDGRVENTSAGHPCRRRDRGRSHPRSGYGRQRATRCVRDRCSTSLADRRMDGGCERAVASGCDVATRPHHRIRTSDTPAARHHHQGR